MRVVVIGAGFAGLAAAESLAAGGAEVDLLDVPENELATLYLLLDRPHGARESGVVRRDEAELGQQQRARVQRVAIGGGDEAPSRRAVTTLIDELGDAHRVGAPCLGALGAADSRGAVASGPSAVSGTERESRCG